MFTERIVVKFTKEERRQLETEAFHREMTLSALIREKLGLPEAPRGVLSHPDFQAAQAKAAKKAARAKRKAL